MVLTDAIAREGLPIGIFVLDTGRLHGDTLALVERIRARYGLELEVFHPDPVAVVHYVREHGRDAFYRRFRAAPALLRDPQGRSRCAARSPASVPGSPACGASTPRRARACRCGSTTQVHGLEKFNPLAAWSEDDVWDYLRRIEVPYNPLHDQGYRSHRLRALHACRRRRRGRARRPLVVGGGRAQGVRPARACEASRAHERDAPVLG